MILRMRNSYYYIILILLNLVNLCYTPSGLKMKCCWCKSVCTSCNKMQAFQGTLHKIYTRLEIGAAG